MKKYLMIMISLIMMLVMTGCSKSVEQQIAEQLELGQKYLAEMNYEEAIVAFQKAIDLEPKTWSAYVGISEAYEALDSYEEAIGILESGMQQIAIEDIPSEDIDMLVGFYKICAEQTEKQGDQNRLLDLYHKILTLRPDDAETKEQLAIMQNEARTGEPENTELEIAESENTEPDNTESDYTEQNEKEQEEHFEESSSSPDINNSDELTERMKLVAEGKEIVCNYWKEQGTFLLEILPPDKAVASTKYVIVDKDHNVILEAYGDMESPDLWRTTNGYVRLAYYTRGNGNG